MKSLGKFIAALFVAMAIMFTIAVIGILWLMLFVFLGPLAIVLIMLAGLAAAVAHNKGKGFIAWLAWGTLFPGFALIAAIAIRRPPVGVYIMKMKEPCN